MSARNLRAAGLLTGAAALACDAPVRKPGFAIDGEGGRCDGMFRITEAAKAIVDAVAR